MTASSQSPQGNSRPTMRLSTVPLKFGGICANSHRANRAGMPPVCASRCAAAYRVGSARTDDRGNPLDRRSEARCLPPRVGSDRPPERMHPYRSVERCASRWADLPSGVPTLRRSGGANSSIPPSPPFGSDEAWFGGASKIAGRPPTRGVSSHTRGTFRQPTAHHSPRRRSLPERLPLP
jgi:hypothetical protein